MQAVNTVREETGEELPIVFLADHDEEGAEDVLQIENTGILFKPFFASAFKEKILEMQIKTTQVEELDVKNQNSLDGLYFLAAEDNEINAEILREILLISNAQCEIVENGQLAVERFANSKEGEFDAILMDVQMPVMNGYDATRAIRALGREDARKIPIIAMTANAFVDDVMDSKRAGMNEHIAKPLDFDRLIECMNRWLQTEDGKGAELL